MKKIILFLLFIFLNSFYFYAQPAIEWQKCFGGRGPDYLSSIQQTTDNGYIVAGFSGSNDGDVTVNQGGWDYWIVKLDSVGFIQWQKSFGGTNDEEPNEIKQTKDNGYIVVGYSQSWDGDVLVNRGLSDYWVIRLDSTGTILWKKSFGGSNNDIGYSVEQTSDEGFIVAGFSDSFDGDVTGNHGGKDYWIFKLDSSGNIQWQKSFGGTNDDIPYKIMLTSDEGFIIAGSSESDDGDVSGNHGKQDNWILRLDSTGAILWQKSFGGFEDDVPFEIQQTKDDGYISAGYSRSHNGDVTGNHGSWDYWVLKLDSIGGMQWQKSFGGTNEDYAYSIQQSNDDGFIVSGVTDSNDGDIAGNHGGWDIGIFKLDSAGDVQWQKTLGGTVDELYSYVRQTRDEGYIVSGYSDSNDGDVSGNHGNFDYWILKLSPLVNINEIQDSIIKFLITPNPFSNETMISFSLSSSDNIKIQIHDIDGREVRNLSTKNLTTGLNKLSWDATDDAGNKVCDGIYFVNVVTENSSESRKIVVLRK